MPLVASLKNRALFQFISLITSIVISISIAVAVPLEKDELGALVNIYLPVLTGVVSLVLYGLIAVISKKVSFRLIALTLCICVNILVGIILNFSFNNFKNRLSNSFINSGFTQDADTVNLHSNDTLVVSNLDRFPSANKAVFSYTYDPDLPNNHIRGKNNIINHDVSSFRLKNNHTKSITINKAIFTSNGLWAISILNRKRSFPITVLPGDSVDLNVTFTAAAFNKRVESFWWKAALKFQHAAVGIGRNFNYQIPYGSTCANINDKLLLESGDKNTPLKPVQLTGIWEYRYENDWEPGLQRILNSLNFKTKVGFTYFDNGLHGEGKTNYSDEIAADYFEVANASQPVKIRKIASYHGCCTIEDSDTLGIYFPNQQIISQLQYTNKYSGQMLLPTASNLPGAKQLAKLSGPFAVKIGLSYTDRNRNHGKKIGIRVWKAVNERGKIISNAYILGSDYLGKKGTNYDYQDNVYYIENIKLSNKAIAPLMAQK